MSKKLIYLICFVSVLSMAGQAWAELILHWRFDEGSGDVVNDSSGNGHVGTIEGATWTVGDKGPCLEFGGDGDRVVDENGPDYLNGLDAITLAVWIKSNQAPTDAGFIICEEPDGGDNIITMRYDAAGATSGGTSVLKMAVVAPGDEQQLESSSNLQTTEWQHVAMTWARGEQLQFYVNGELDTPSSNGAPRDVSTGDVTILIVGQGGKDAAGGWNGLIDDVRIYDNVLTQVEIQAAMEGTVWPYAIGPVPADGAYHEDTWVNLSWTPGPFAVSHDVYLGENFDAVNEGAEGTFIGNQAETFIVAGFPGFPYPDGLVPGTNYYWRIDEVNDSDPNSPWKGDIWSFMIPPKTAYLPEPADAAEAVEVNTSLTWTPGFGAKLHTVYFGDNFDEVSNAEGGLPQGAATYSPSQLEMAKAYYWRVDEFDAIGTHKGDVWSFTTEGAVAALNPANGAVDVTQTPVLTWAPGLGASHEVYFGADAASLELKGSGNLGSESYDPGQLEWNTTYYWRVDEANGTNADSPWTGPLWSFTTANFLIVDDMESYNDLDEGQPGSNRIYLAWIDGFDNPETNGSVVGNLDPPFAEQTIVHSGLQSMPMSYDNAVGKSEATLTLTSNRDWTVNGVNTLTIWFRGSAGNAAENLYVALNGSAVVNNDDPDAALKTSWTPWDIDLTRFADQGVNLPSINSITLGLGNRANPVAGGSGMMYFDDIRLYAR